MPSVSMASLSPAQELLRGPRGQGKPPGQGEADRPLPQGRAQPREALVPVFRGHRREAGFLER